MSDELSISGAGSSDLRIGIGLLVAGALLAILAAVAITAGIRMLRLKMSARFGETAGAGSPHAP